MKKLKAFLAFIITVALWTVNASAYEVWMGTHLSTHTMAITPSAWSMTASKLEGININRAPHDTDPATTADWKSMIARYTNAGTVMTEMARSEPTRDPSKVDALLYPYLDAELAQKFQEASNYNFALDYPMFYDNALAINGAMVNFNWTATEAQYIRTWLDAKGHANVKLMWNARNNSSAN